MGYQFIHVEAYSREASKQKEGGRNVREIIAEAGREPGNCPHVEHPKPPEILFGSLHQAENAANTWAEQATDLKGRKLRKDGHCLLAGAISLSRLEEEEKWPEFVDRCIAHLVEKYEDRLKCVVAHQNDEEHPHIHFYVVPKFGERFEVIHEGQKAAKQAKAEGKLKGEQNAAYISSMRTFQDEFSKQVGVFLGLTRIGPGRRRLTRAAWNAEQKQADFFANAKKMAKKGYQAGAKKGYQDGFEKGQQKALFEAEKLGAKAGAILDVFKGAWHKPTQEKQAEIEDLKAQVKATEDRAKKQADRAIQDERKRTSSTLIELEKYKNIAINTEAENKRLCAEIETFQSYKKDSKFKPI